MDPILKGLFADFTCRVHGTVTRSEIRFTLSVLHVSIPVAATVNFKVSRIGPIAPLLILVGHFGLIRDTIKSTVAATGTEKNEEKKIGEQTLYLSHMPIVRISGLVRNAFPRPSEGS